MTPTGRTLQQLRADGWTAAVTERWNQYARIRQDLLGFIDVLAFHPQNGTLAIQTTSGDHTANRVTKIVSDPDLANRARTYLLAGRGFHTLEVWGWHRHKVKRGGTALRYELVRRPITLEDLDGPQFDGKPIFHLGIISQESRQP